MLSALSDRRRRMRVLLIVTAVAMPLVVWSAGRGTSSARSTLTPRGHSVPSAVRADTSAPMIAGGPGGRVSLGGPWTVRMDPAGHGGEKGWATGLFSGRTVTIPYSPNAGVVTGANGIRSFRGSVAWYRTTFTVPADGDYAIRFESVNHRAAVWVDGLLAGTHTGEYLPFEIRLPLRAGETHTLVVRADWRSPAAMKRAGWHRTWFNFGGINRDVTLRPLGSSELVAPTITTRLVPEGAAVDVTVHVHNRAGARDVPVTGALVRDGVSIPLTFPTLHIEHNGWRVLHAQAVVSNPALWSPSAPNLYQLTLAVPSESSYATAVGLRQISWSHSRLFLNGQPLILRGASLQEDVRGRGDALLPSDMDAIVSDLKSIGANATRCQHPVNPALVERLDAAGILLWQGVGPVDAPGSWTSRTPRMRKQARDRVRVSVRQLQTHPSIVAWNLANEVAGNGHPGGQAHFIDQMAQELHVRDPGRLVAVDVWGVHAPKVAGGLYRHVDAIGATNYVGWYESTLAPRPVVARTIRQRVESLRRTFAGKVLVISEFGAEANAANPSTRPGGYRFQARLLRLHIAQYRRIPSLAGMLVWDLRDFAVAPSFLGGSIRRAVGTIALVRGLNQKGLLDYSGRPKPAAAVVRKWFLALPDAG